MKPQLKFLFLLSLIVPAFSSAGAGDWTSIPPGDPNIRVEGARFAQSVPEGIELLRFPLKLYDMGYGELRGHAARARMTTGVRLVLKTAAPSVRFRFVTKPDVMNKGADFGVLINGKPAEPQRFPKEEETQVVECANPAPGSPALFEVILPSWANPIFTGVEIPAGAELLPLEPSARKIYVALGDSISHGTGQGSASYKTFPFLVAQALDFSLFNMSIGGSQVSLPIAKELGQFDRIDLITILIGFNDWQSGKSPDQFGKELDDVIGAIRDSHPAVEIACIRPITTAKTESEKGGGPITEFRDAVSKVVETRRAAGDKHIAVIAGEDLTTPDDLLDGIHLTPKGAANFAGELSAWLAKQLPPKS